MGIGGSGKEVDVILEKGGELGYETAKRLYSLTLPLMWILTLWVMIKKKIFRRLGQKVRTNTLWFDGLSVPCRRIKEGFGSWRALDVIYHFSSGADKSIGGAISDYWIGMRNAQAVRNRLKLVIRQLSEAIENVRQGGTKAIRIASIASGSAEAFLNAMKNAEGAEIKATMIDISRSALRNSEKAAHKAGLRERCSFEKRNMLDFEKFPADLLRGSNLIEMVGLLDYLSDDQIVKLIGLIRENLEIGGFFLTGHIIKNPERHFLKWVINWEMRYRGIREFGRLLVRAGFDKEKVTIFVEPQGIHMVAVCRK